MLLSLTVAVLPALVALVLQLLLWPLTNHVWFLFFYPAVFLSSWLGGMRAALVATAVSLLSVLWFFIPPRYSVIALPEHYVPLGVFLTMGVLFGAFHERLRKAVRERRIFAELVENSSDFIGIADAAGMPVYINPAGRRMVGLPADRTVETTTIPEYYPPDQRAFASDVIVKSMVERGHWEGETAFRNWQTDEAIPVSDTHFMIRDRKTGEVLGTGTVTRDISDLKRARDDMAALLEQAPDGVFVADLEGRYIEVNRAGCSMLGYTRDEILGKTIVDLIPAGEEARLEHERAHLLAGQSLTSEWTLRRKDGTDLPVEVSAQILPDGRWQAFVRDISARKALEEALRASVADLARAQAVAEVGSWRLDVRHDQLQWSHEEYRMFGVSPGTPMTYEGFLACVHPDDREYVAREWAAALRGEPYDIEHRIVAGDVVKWVREKANLEFDERGALVGGIGITQDITFRKRAEEELRKAQERYELALRGADLGSWDWNIETGEAVFNARWAEMRGFRLDELEGRVDTWTSGVHPDDLPRVRQVLDDYLHGRRPDYEVEHRARTKSGEWIWILDRGKVFGRDERGAPVRMVGTELDITFRKRAEEELRLAEAKATGILSISADAIITIDPEQRMTLFNEGAVKIFGYTKAEALGAPLDMLFPARFRAIHRQHVQRFAAGDETARRMGEREMAIVGRRKDGREFPADAAISKLTVGGTTILTVAVRDVTEQTRLEHEQRFLSDVGSVLASTLELPATLESIGRLATRDFADLCVVYLLEEREISRLRAVARDPGKAWICDVLVQLPVDTSRVQELWSELAANRPVLVEQIAPETLEGWAQSAEHLRALRALDPRSSISVPLFAHGRMVGAMALLSSDPARRYAPPDVRLAEQLALRAAFAVENAQLYAAAQRAIETRDKVLGIVAHDLRNPLGTILMQCALVRNRAPDPDRRSRRPCDSIERSARRMNRLIEDLLDVARMEQGRLSVQQARVPTTQLVLESVEAQEPLAAAASLELLLDVPRDLPDVWADRDRLLQVFENLIGNAVKFTDPGGVITVGAAPGNGEVLFWVADTGAGIAAEDVPRVFDRFWQAESGARHGAGLGLPIVKGLVEAHGGRIWVESTAGQGTTFFFTIPTAPHLESWRAEPALR